MKPTKQHKEFVEDCNLKITKIDEQAYAQALYVWGKFPDVIKRGKFYLKLNHPTSRYLAIDNSTGDFWVEEFSSRRKAINYLVK